MTVERKGRGARRSSRFVFGGFDLERRRLMAYAPTVAAYQVNQVTEGGQYKARTTVAPDGVTTIVWEDRGLDGDGFGIYARRIDASGKPLGDQFRVNTTTVGEQAFPLIGSDARGNVVIAWKDTQLSEAGLSQYYQRYDPQGAPIGGNVRLPQMIEYGDDYSMEVAPDGGFTLIQHNFFQTTFRRYDAAGSLVVDTAVVRPDDGWTYQYDSYRTAATALTSGGVLVEAWMDLRTRPQPAGPPRYDGRAMIRLIGPDGKRVGSDIQLASASDAVFSNDATAFFTDVTPLAGGGFLATWFVTTLDRKYSLVGQRFDASGAKVGPEITFLPSTTDDDVGEVAQLKNGNLVAVVVQRFGGTKPDAADFRIFDPAGTPITGRIPMAGLPNTRLSLMRVAPTSGSGFQVNWGLSGMTQADGEVYFQAFAEVASAGMASPAVRVGEGSGVASIYVVRDGDLSSAASVRYGTRPGTAAAGADYAAVSGVVNFVPGQVSAYIAVPILRDALAEVDETFTVTLSDPVGVALGGSTSTVVTIADDPAGTAGPALPNVYLDRGAAGLWSWTAGVGLAQIGVADPEGMAVGRDGVVYVDYGPYGLWRWAGDGLVQINAANPENLLVAPDGSLYVDFGPYGLWRRDASGGMAQINAADPEGFAAAADGSLYVDFGPYGLWRRDAAGIVQVNAANPEGMAVAPDGTLYVDFGPYGFWRRDAAGIVMVNPSNPEALVAAADGSIFVDFGPYGLWRWAGGFSQINAADPEKMAAAADGSLYIDYGPFGLWTWTAAGFAQIHTANAEGLAVGRDGFVYVDFGAGGVWRRGAAGGFERVDPADAQALA